MTGWLLVAGDFMPHGGMDRANLEFARLLAADSPVHLVGHRAADELREHPNVTFHPVSRPLGRHLLGAPLLARAGWRWATGLAAEGFRVVVNGGNCRWPDANWLHYVHAAAPPPVVPGLFRRVAARFGRRAALRDERVALASARVVVCNSRRTARDAVELVGVRPDRTRVVYLGTDSAAHSPISPGERTEARRRLGWDDRPWVVFVGGLGDARKGFDTLYAACADLCRGAGWDANLAAVGAGASLPGWRARAAADGLAGRVHFLGFRTDVPDILAASDLLVHPARYEPYGLAPHEALCRGLPALVSAAAGVCERYPPELADLILTDPESPGELADRLRHWRANLETLAARVRPFADALRSRTWTDMARDVRDAVAPA